MIFVSNDVRSWTENMKLREEGQAKLDAAKLAETEFAMFLEKYEENGRPRAAASAHAPSGMEVDS